jgi:hypothetical protein
MTVLKENKEEAEEIEVTTEKLPSITVHANFKTNSDKVIIKSKATGEETSVVAANKKIRLISGRLYYIPVDADPKVNSDEYGSIKEFSATADKFSIKFIRNGMACIDPIQHHAQIENLQQLCVLW